MKITALYSIYYLRFRAAPTSQSFRQVRAMLPRISYALPFDISLCGYAAFRRPCSSMTLKTMVLHERKFKKRRVNRIRQYGSTTSSNFSHTINDGHVASTPSTSPEPALPASPSFKFSLAASFLGKPMISSSSTSKSTTRSFTFGPDSPIRKWRDALLEPHGRYARTLLEKQNQDQKRKGKQTQSLSAGDDFFFMHQPDEANSHERATVLGVAASLSGTAIS